MTETESNAEIKQRYREWLKAESTRVMPNEPKTEIERLYYEWLKAEAAWAEKYALEDEDDLERQLADAASEIVNKMKVAPITNHKDALFVMAVAAGFASDLYEHHGDWPSEPCTWYRRALASAGIPIRATEFPPGEDYAAARNENAAMLATFAAGFRENDEENRENIA